jgi:asparagine synthase (glutamine-hydrolysing)
VCGIAGVVRPGPESVVEESSLLRMARAVRHRGPDGFGLAIDRGAGFVSTRLAIVDLPLCCQPLQSRDSGGLLGYNGEVYNHPELRAELRSRGEMFESESDTEVVLRLLERDGLDALHRLNGQFALAWWHAEARRLVLVRDRFGVRPLYHALSDDGTLVFGSEAKALFASGEVSASADLQGLDDVFTLWGPRPPRTPFRGVSQLPPGGLLIWERGKVTAERTWWSADAGSGAAPGAELGELLRDSVSLRLRADVPVGAYLSGGLDSSVITALAREQAGHRLRTFSVAFSDPLFDERAQQEVVARALGTDHHTVEITSGDIAAAFPEVIRHAESPLVRTAPVPLFLLAQEVRRHSITVVITGEGADELFWGYDLFKEVTIRELHDREPERALALLDQLYPYLGAGAARRGPAWRRFLLETGARDDLLRSHLTRVEATATVKAFYHPDVAAELERGVSSVERLRSELPRSFGRWSALQRAAWLEVKTLLGPYLLAAQGDRVAMAHGVEGRFPFLDHRVYELASAMGPERKLDGVRDKIALREVASTLLPDEATARPKQPYRAPEVAPFFGPDSPDWVGDLLSPTGLSEAGLWDAQRVAGLVRRAEAGRVEGIRESMALVGILSTGLWHRAFIGQGAGAYPAETAEPRVRIDHTAEVARKELA